MNYSLITGACGGLGKAFCKELYSRGENLFLVGRSEEKLENLKNELSAYGNGDILYFALDLTKETERKKLYEFIFDKDLKFSALYNVAGVDIQKPFSDYTEEKIIFQTRVNLEATLSISRFVLERRAENFKLLTVSSMSGTLPMPYFAIYSATKCALINFFTALRYEYKGKGVKITVLAPGGIPTRADIIEDIKIQGFTGKLSSKPAEFVVEKALKGLDKNKRLVIPGAFNKFVYILEKFAPVSIKCRYVAKKWSRKSKDAF